MGMTNVIDLDSYSKQKFFNQIEDIRKKNYEIIKMFPHLDNEYTLSNLYKAEKKSQFIFTSDYEENVSPCFSSFSCDYTYAEHLNMHQLDIKSLLSVYQTSKTPSRSYVKEDDGTVSSGLPIVASFILYSGKSELEVTDSSDTLELDTILRGTLGSTFFSSLILVLLAPLFNGSKDFDGFEIKTANLREKTTPSDTLELILQNSQQELRVLIYHELCDSEFNNFIDKTQS